MNCKHCGEEIIESASIDLGGGDVIINECPNFCEEIKWLEKQSDLIKLS